MNLSFILNNILIFLLLTEIYPYSNCNYGGGSLKEFLGNDTNRKEKCFSLSYSFGNKECCIEKKTENCINLSNSTSDEPTEPTSTTEPTSNTESPLTTELSSNSDILDSIASSDIITNKALLRNANENDEYICQGKNELNINNNCGMAGINMPEKNTTCNGISLVQGYCCFTKMKIKDSKDNKEYTACLRAKQLNKDKNKAPHEIDEYVKNNGGEIVSVECGKFSLKLYWTLNFILSMIYLF
jgi:hypothetical protein